MRKPRDYDAELRALTEKTRAIKERKVQQLGELVIATGADALPVEQLAGAMLAAVETRDAAIVEVQRQRGAAYFQRGARGTAPAFGDCARSEPAGGYNAQSSASGSSAP